MLRLRGSRKRYKIPPAPAGPTQQDPYDFGGFQETMVTEQRRYGATQYGASQFANGGGFLGGAQRSSMMARPSYSPYREHEDEVGNNEMLERDVQLLNHCFDDIEKFVARLQQAAEAFKDLERRRRERERGGGRGKKNVGGDGMLAQRARPPPAADFVDIFQKFKLSFNLLAKLKAHIHDPNAPELVHFLFTPLSLIFEASRDPVHGSVNLGEQAVAPVLTQDSKQLLQNCLTSKEIELWQSLGKNWTTSKDEWKGYIPPYVPRFYDGWQPAPPPQPLEDSPPVSRANLEKAAAAHHNQILNRQQEMDAREYVRERVVPFPPEEERFPRGGEYRTPAQVHRGFESDVRAPSPPREALSNPSVVGYRQYVEQHIDRSGYDGRNYMAQQQPRRAAESSISHHAPAPAPAVSQPPQPALDNNTAYLMELRKMDAKVYEVGHDRQGKNSKELTVTKGEYVQILDDSKNWWKVRNYKGQSGFCPYTILKEVKDTKEQGAASEQGGAGPSADRRGSGGGNKRELRAQEGEVRYGGSSAAVVSPRYDRQREVMGPPPSTTTTTPPVRERGEVPSPRGEQGGEEEGGHAFRPVEPALYTNKAVLRGGIRPTQPQIDLHNELRSKMGLPQGQGHYRGGGGGVEEERRFDPLPHQHQPPPPPTHQPLPSTSPPGSTAGVQTFYITSSSSQSDVAAWLESKGFSTLCRQSLQGFTGEDLFFLHRQEMDQLVGHEEAARLQGQLTLQKKMTGYKTQSAAELNAIFQKRRARTDIQGTSLGQPPEFRPLTPSSYDGQDSDSEDGDRGLAETGKTLRDLLIRQRQKIIGTSVFTQQ